MARRAATRPEKERKEAFLKALRETGVVAHAARIASPGTKTPTTTFYEWRLLDEEFAREWDAALEQAIADAELELRRRAIDGWEEPVFQKGELVGTVKRKSDRMLELLIKRHIPQYNEKRQVEYSGGVDFHLQGNITVEAHIKQEVMQRASTLIAVAYQLMNPAQLEALAEMLELYENPTPDRLAAINLDPQLIEQVTGNGQEDSAKNLPAIIGGAVAEKYRSRLDPKDGHIRSLEASLRTAHDEARRLRTEMNELRARMRPRAVPDPDPEEGATDEPRGPKLID